MSEEKMEYIEGIIKDAESKEAYPFDFDVAQYKMDFATLMAILEEASEQAEEPVLEKEVVSENKNVWTVLKDACTFRYAGNVAAAIAFIATLVGSAIRRGDVMR